MGFLSFIERNRHAINKEFAGTDKNWYFSATTASLYSGLLPIIRQNAKGAILDAGAGDLQYKSLLQRYGSSYESFDIERRQESIDHLGDVQDMRGIPSALYDTVFCNQVLEHVPEPQKAIAEFFRILKPGGKLILAVPHLSRLHEEPHDYYRYTQYSVAFMLERARFHSIETTKAGGLFCFLFHQLSTLYLSLFWRIPVIKNLTYYINKIFFVHCIVFLDKVFNTGVKFPLNIIAVARKDE